MLRGMHGIRVAHRETLVHELRSFADDRAQVGNVERSEDARRAATEIADGADLTFFERIFYVVGGSCDRWTVRRMPRETAIAELRDAAEGWQHQGKPMTAKAALRAAEAVAGGADYVRCGHIVYDISDARSHSVAPALQ